MKARPGATAKLTFNGPIWKKGVGGGGGGEEEKATKNLGNIKRGKEGAPSRVIPNIWLGADTINWNFGWWHFPIKLFWDSLNPMYIGSASSWFTSNKVGPPYVSMFFIHPVYYIQINGTSDFLLGFVAAFVCVCFLEMYQFYFFLGTPKKCTTCEHTLRRREAAVCHKVSNLILNV